MSFEINTMDKHGNKCPLTKNQKSGNLSCLRIFIFYLKKIIFWKKKHKVNVLGSSFGYTPNAAKTSLLVKEGAYEKACDLFDGSGVSIVTDGVKVLGCPIGIPSYVESAVKVTIDEWCNDFVLLAEIAQSQPQAAYSSFVHGLFGRWCYFFRTCILNDGQLSSLEDKLRNHLIPSLTGKDSINDNERVWLSLPNRFGGMGIIRPSQFSS